MTLSWILAAGGAVYAFGLAVLVFWRAPRRLAHISFSLGMLALAGEQCLAWEAAKRTGLIWQVLWLSAHAITAAPWLYFSICYARGVQPDAARRWTPTVAMIFVAFMAMIAGSNGDLIYSPSGSAESGYRLTTAGMALNLSLFAANVLILANLERTFRSSVGVMRWRIKYVIFGVAALFVFRLFQSSQSVLYSSPEFDLHAGGSSALVVACGLVSIGLMRAKLFDVDIYPSHAVLVRTLAFVLSGVYLIAVGLLAQMVRLAGRETRLPLLAFLVLLALVGLTVGLVSERCRRVLHEFVARHFQRPSYDYRLKWMTFTAETASPFDEERFCRAVVKWCADTFRALSVNVWLPNEDKDRFHLGASTSLNQASAERLGTEDCHWQPVVQAMLANPEPVDIESSRLPWLTDLRRLSPGIFPKAGAHLCMPLCAGGEFLGLVTLGDRVGYAAFTTEDRDLLKCVGDQVAAGLLKIALSKRLLGAKELEAFQTMSAFFVHDLKNTASSLSLMLQNLRDHFGNPEFREDAVRAVGKSVQRLEELIGKLSQLRQDLSPKPIPADLSVVAQEAIGKAGPMPHIQLVTNLKSGARCLLDPEQIEKVVLNLVLNARDAVGDRGEISVKTGLSEGWATLSVKDNGCGMSGDFVRRSLFRPFQTTKKRGIGIGMFQSKMIVDAHRGRIEVVSAPGCGTEFQILLPIQ